MVHTDEIYWLGVAATAYLVSCWIFAAQESGFTDYSAYYKAKKRIEGK